VIEFAIERSGSQSPPNPGSKLWDAGTVYLNLEALFMRSSSILALLLVFGCARNPDTQPEQLRVRDTALTSEDTVAPDDTLDRSRRTIPDTAGGLDTTSRQ
jgi:hypothetical protein